MFTKHAVNKVFKMYLHNTLDALREKKLTLYWPLVLIWRVCLDAVHDAFGEKTYITRQTSFTGHAVGDAGVHSLWTYELRQN